MSTGGRPLNDEQRRRVDEILAELSDLPAAETQVRLESMNLEEAIRAEVRSRLTTGTDTRPTQDAPAPFSGAGEHIGPYKLVRPIGEGGFGIVWLAEQMEPVRRTVAVKVIKPGMDSKAVIARFEAERQALALMDHPNVARVFDGGTTDRGLPYFVMELVKGEPVTDYCDRHNLSIHDRLELFADICDAVHHAHQKGIIHRDIKPSNVLVAISEGRKPLLKVIDFGVAKAMAAPLTEATLFTAEGQLVGTPEYMSPEQADSAGTGALDIDTRSDVYALGVLLYELLTGARPFDLRRIGMHEMRRVIREEAAPRPSTRLSSLGDEATTIAKHRRVELATLNRQLRGDLEWIPLKAMRKDRTERYRSAADLADDVRRYLKGEALEAGPEAASYRLRKFVKRNRGLVMSVAVVMLVLFTGTVVVGVQALRINSMNHEYLRLSEEATDLSYRVQSGLPTHSLSSVEIQYSELGWVDGTDQERIVDPSEDPPLDREALLACRLTLANKNGLFFQPATSFSPSARTYSIGEVLAGCQSGDLIAETVLQVIALSVHGALRNELEQQATKVSVNVTDDGCLQLKLHWTSDEYLDHFGPDHSPFAPEW